MDNQKISGNISLGFKESVTVWLFVISLTIAAIKYIIT